MAWLERCSLIVALLAAGAVQAAPRSHAARAEFKRAHPCPANGHRSGSCPGYVIDHVVPVCAGGPDKPSNMQWQTSADAKVKDREEVRACRNLSRQ